MSEQPATGRSKVARLIEKYALQDVGDQLEQRWTRTENRSSLRDLAEYFNKTILETKLKAVDSDPLESEIESLYQQLTNEDVTSGRRQQVRSRLRRRGVDVDELEGEFVSYQSIRTYLRNYLQVRPPENSPSPKEQRQKKKKTIQQLKSRLSTVTQDSLRELKNAGRLSLGDFSVIVTVHVHCSDCESRISATELLKRGHCDCPK